MADDAWKRISVADQFVDFCLKVPKKPLSVPMFSTYTRPFAGEA